MLKLIVFLLGLAVGGSGAVSWLLSEPDAPHSSSPPLDRDSLQARLVDLQVRFRAALAEGERAGGETEERVRREFDAYRKNPDRAPAS